MQCHNNAGLYPTKVRPIWSLDCTAERNLLGKSFVNSFCPLEYDEHGHVRY